MLSENLDDKIKDTLTEQTTAYEESSWLKMKTLLDKHLPEKKKDRRRLLFFLFLFLIAGGGFTILFNGGNSENKTGSNTSPVTKNENVEIKNPTQLLNESSKISKENNTTYPETGEGNNHKDVLTKVAESLTANKNIFSEQPKEKKSAAVISKNKFDNISDKQPDITEKNNSLTDNTKEATGIIKTNPSAEIIIITNQSEKKPAEEKNTEPLTLTGEITNPEKEKSPETIATETKKQKAGNQKSFLKNILFTISAGPDISAVGIKHLGNIRTSYGAGIGYKISNRFTVRTGIYSGRKVYEASPEDYNPPANFWNYYPNLKTIDADCKVLELPLTIDYSFSFSKKHNWFASAGLSSLFMKKEEYDYYFKPTNSPQYVYYSRTYYNRTKHYFSILNLSAGYVKKINPHLSLQAEPYFKIALNGIGYGNVKLNSGGILFTAILQPFNQTVQKEIKK